MSDPTNPMTVLPSEPNHLCAERANPGTNASPGLVLLIRPAARSVAPRPRSLSALAGTADVGKRSGIPSGDSDPERQPFPASLALQGPVASASRPGSSTLGPDGRGLRRQAKIPRKPGPDGPSSP